MNVKYRGVLAACCIAPLLWACGGQGDDADMAENAADGSSAPAAADSAADGAAMYQEEFNAMDANGDGEVTLSEYNAYRAE